MSRFPLYREELTHRHVTRQLVWEEYRHRHPDGYGRSQFGLLLQAERDNRHESRISRLLHNAHMRQQATIEHPETDTTKGLSSAQVSELAAGTEKSYFATLVPPSPDNLFLY